MRSTSTRATPPPPPSSAPTRPGSSPRPASCAACDPARERPHQANQAAVDRRRGAGRRPPHPGQALGDLRGRPPRPRDQHRPRRTVSAIAGTAAVALGLAAAVLGIATLALGLRRGDPRLLKGGQRYVWIVLAGAVLAAAAM